MDTRQRTTWGSRFRFLVRALGLIGVLVAICGLSLLWAEYRENLRDLASVERFRAVAEGADGEFARTAAQTFALGAAAALIGAAIELLGVVFSGASRRTAAGAVATLGVVAALALVGVVNVYSFTHYGRHDCTRDQRFTLPPELTSELSKLRANAPTTIVVLQMHNTFGNLPTKRDSFTSAAEREVTEKVRDLVDQFREFGPQFNVVVLDTEAFEYDRELTALTKDAPELKTAIDAAPENSIFFHANKRVQRLSFNEFMQLDKTASREADGGGANLVLVPQGVDRFARRVLSVQERRPKVAVCVVHELLTTAADDPENRFTLSGLKASLTEQGFDVVDIVLKKGWSNARSISDLKPAADTREESKLERVSGELDDANTEVASSRAEVRQFELIHDLVNSVKGRPWEERKAAYMRFLRGTPIEEREADLLAALDKQLKRARDELEEALKTKQEAEKKLTEALKDERPLQDSRMSDVSAKLSKQLADVDLLVISRYTVEDAMKGPGVEATLHALSREQVKVAKEFMKSGKPVLACLGPITPQVIPQAGEPPDKFYERLATEIGANTDGFERLLAERGVELGRSVILFDGETKSLAGGDPFAGIRPTEAPPVVFADQPAGLNPNPVAAAFQLTGHAAAPGPGAGRSTGRGTEQKFEIRLRALRPVTLAPGWQAKQPFAAEIAFSAGESWSELQPYPRRGRRPDGTSAVIYAPKYEPTALDDPKKGTRDEERRGPFPVGVAIANRIPVAWVNEDYERQQGAAALLAPFDGTLAAGLTIAAERVERPTQRTVVFGSGTLFNGAELKPAQEKLLVHTANWLTNRADRLPKPAGAENPQWHYPRVAMSDRDRELWRLAAFPGLPALVAVIGLFVMMIRRMR
jgi:hypothetical protein